MKKILTGIAFLVMMCSCSGITKQTNVLEGKNYVLQIEENKKIIKKDKETKKDKKNEENKEKTLENQITISFNDENFYGNGGVNRYFGKYDAKNGKISFSYFAATKLSADKELVEKENEYFELLNKVNKYSLKKDILVLTCSDGKILKYKEIQDSKEKDKKKGE